MIAHGFTIDMMVELVHAGLAISLSAKDSHRLLERARAGQDCCLPDDFRPTPELRPSLYPKNLLKRVHLVGKPHQRPLERRGRAIVRLTTP
jgi:hypothetical protein